MASAGSGALPKMAAVGAQGRSRTETLGPLLPGRQRQRKPPGRCAKGERPATVSARPAGEEPPEACSLCCSDQGAGRRPSKRQKCEGKSPVKSELEGLETSKPSDGDQLSGDPGDCNAIQQQRGESIPEAGEDKREKEPPASLKAGAEQSSSAPSEGESEEQLHVCSEEERSPGSPLSEGSSVEDAEVPRRQVELDSSALLSEDSSQPMPVARFFGEVEDLPAVAVPSTVLSRREFRKLHFIAKEEEEEEEEEEDAV